MNTALLLFPIFVFQSGQAMERPYPGGALNPGSTMNMIWSLSNDKSPGAIMDGWQGVTVRASDDGTRFFYRLEYQVKALKDLKAFEITAVLFNAFRNFQENWRMGMIQDLKEGQVTKGMFEKEVTKEAARLLGGSYLYISTTISGKGTPAYFNLDPTFIFLKALMPRFKSSWVYL